MSFKPTQVVAGTLFVAAASIPIVLAQQSNGQYPAQAASAPPALQSATSISADDHYLYVLGNGQITRIDKASGMASGQLTSAGWGGSEPAAKPGGGAAGGGEKPASTAGAEGSFP